MKKIIYTLIIATLLFSCEDTFVEYYQGGISSRYEPLTQFGFSYEQENSYDENGYWYSGCGVEYNQGFKLKLPPHSTTITGIISTSTDWKFTNIPDWITITPSNGTANIIIDERGDILAVGEDTIKFTLTDNSSITPRLSMVFLERSMDKLKDTDTIHISQYGLHPTLEGDSGNYTMKACADTVNIYLNSNCDFGVEVENDPYVNDTIRLGWLKAAVEKSDSVNYTHKIILTSDNYIPSDYNNEYYSYVNFYYNSLETGDKSYLDFQIKVTKEVPYMTFENETSSITVAPENDSKSVLVNSNCDFEVISNATWINPTQKSYKYAPTAQEIGINVDDYSFTDNEGHSAGGGESSEETYHDYPTFSDRQSTLKLCYINSSDTIVLKTIYVKQSKPTIEQYSSDGYYSSYLESLTFGPTTGTQEVFIKANHTFSIQHEDWISVTTEAIEHEYHTHKLTISVPEYITDNLENWDSRSGTIVFRYQDKANNSYINVNGIDITQEVPKATPSPSYVYLRTFETECTINVKANCRFTPICNGDWIYIKDIVYDDSTSTYNAKIIIGFKPYPEEDAIKNNEFPQRSAYLELYYQTDDPNMVKKLSYISFSDYPDKITASQNTIEINSSGQTLSFDIEADLSWNATSDVEWINITPIEGTMGKNTITINVQQSDVERREGYIHFYLVRNKYEPALSIKIIQVKTN